MLAVTLLVNTCWSMASKNGAHGLPLWNQLGIASILLPIDIDMLQQLDSAIIIKMTSHYDYILPPRAHNTLICT